MNRTIKQIVTGSNQTDGAGVKLVRVIGHATVEDFDPFLMLDAFDSTNPDDYTKGFPWHPHRGIETVTYLITGDIDHGDNIGNAGSILDGGCQWMTAGSGILHQEMPKACERMLGVQLWLNMPAAHKMSPPKYHDIIAEMVPIVSTPGATIRIISGEYDGVDGPFMGDYVRMTFFDVDLEANVQWSFETVSGNTLFVYNVEGSGYFGDDDSKSQPSKCALLFESDGDFKVTAGENGLRFLLFSGKPLKEPVAWGGPIVMNTREELRQAFKELEDGTFIKHK